ncbi:MAG TPA: hypothetical protein VIL35_03905 [Vicinamibacterales bacterium]
MFPRLLYGIAFVAFGLEHLVFGDFVTRVVPWWPEWLPPRGLWVVIVGLVLVAAGIALVIGKQVRSIATALGIGLLLSFVLLGVPLAASGPVLGGAWTVAGKALALAGGALLLVDAERLRLPTSDFRLRQAERLYSLAPWCFGAFLLLCGIQHFVHEAFVASLVPAWIPGARFWTWFTGAALIAAGIGVVAPRTSRLAGLLTGLMIFTWVIVLHIPRAFAMRNTNELTAVFEALAMSGIGLLIGLKAQGSGLKVALTSEAGGKVQASTQVPPG